MKRLKVLFVCVENSFRSQISQGMANAFFGDRIEAASAGSKPSGKVHPSALATLGEIGVDTSGLRSKGFGDLKGIAFDIVVTMGCGDACPIVPAKTREDWTLPDIKNASPEKIRELREDIRNRIANLLEKFPPEKS